MADEDKTPETEETPDSIKEEVQTAASEEGAGEVALGSAHAGGVLQLAARVLKA